MNQATSFDISEFTNPSGEVVFRVSGQLDGKRVRKNFATRAAAQAERQVLEIAKLQSETGVRTAATRLEDEQLRETEAAFHRLEGRTRPLTFYLDFALINYRDPIQDMPLTDAASSVESLFTWANALQGRAHYLVVKNQIAGDDFGYFENTKPGRAFIAQAAPQIIELKARAREIQSELDNRGLTAAQALTVAATRRGPLLNGGTARMRTEAYARQIDAALDSAREVLHP